MFFFSAILFEARYKVKYKQRKVSGLYAMYAGNRNKRKGNGAGIS